MNDTRAHRRTLESPPVARVLDRLRSAGSWVRSRGDDWDAECPAHFDVAMSLAIGVGSGRRALILCRSGCPTYEVLAELGLTFADLHQRGGAQHG